MRLNSKPIWSRHAKFDYRYSMPKELKPLPPPDPSGGPMTLSYYAVAFVDLLGQSEALKRLKLRPETDDERRDAEDAMAKTGRLIRQMRNSFSELIDRGKDVPLDGIPPERLEEFKKFSNPPLFQMGFSDSFVLALQLPTDIKDPVQIAQVANGVFLMLLGLAGTTLIATSSGVPLRGGVDINLGMDVFPNEVYGPALMNAYRLESEIAQYPRTVLGRNLLHFLYWLNQLKDDHPMLELAKRMGRRCNSLMREDHDGHVMIHFLSPMLRDALKTDDFDNRWAHARAWTVDEIRRFSKAGDDKHRARYIQLVRYLDAHRPPDEVKADATG